MPRPFAALDEEVSRWTKKGSRMREETARRLARLTSDFYAQVTELFSATRSAPWEGWARVLAEARRGSLGMSPEAGKDPNRLRDGTLRVLDLACGNLRFERYLDDAIDEARQGSESSSSAFGGSRSLSSEGSASGWPSSREGSQTEAPQRLRPMGQPSLREDCSNNHLSPFGDPANSTSSLRKDCASAPPFPVGFSSAEVYAFDNCDELARADAFRQVTVAYRHLDIVGTLFEREDLATRLSTPPCDLSVCFGFMHHLPLAEHRSSVMRALVDRTRPGGLVALSFWQLSHSERLLAKARETTEMAWLRLGLDDLGQGDYLLGWQERRDVLRFCHDFPEDEIDELVEVVSDEAQEIARYSADGATGDLNRYLLLRRR